MQGLQEEALSKRGVLKLEVTRLHLNSTRWVSNVAKQVKNAGRAIVGSSKHNQ